MSNLAIIKEFNDIIDRRSWDDIYDIVTDDIEFRTPFMHIKGRVALLKVLKTMKVDHTKIDNLYYFHNRQTQIYYLVYRAIYNGKENDVLFCHQSFEFKSRLISRCSTTTSSIGEYFADPHFNLNIS